MPSALVTSVQCKVADGTSRNCSPRPVPTAVPPINGNAASEPSRAASADRSARTPHRWEHATRAAAASAEPPAIPPATGIALRTVSATSAGTPVVSASSAAARQARLRSSVGSSGAPNTLSDRPCAGTAVTSSYRSTAAKTVVSSWNPSGRSGPTARCRLILAGTRTRTDIRASVRKTRLQLAEGGEQLLLRPLEEAVLVLAADLHHGDVREAGVEVLLHRGHVRGDVRSARDRARDVVLRHELARAGEPGRAGQLGVHLPAEAEPPELVVRPFDRRVAVLVVADRQLPDALLACATGRVELLAQRAVRLDRDHEVGELTRELTGLRAGHRDPDLRRRRGHVPQLRGVDPEVPAGVVHVVAAEQLTDDLDRLSEHLVPDVHRRPAGADDVLVEVLAGTEAEGEPSVAEHAERRRLLRNDGRVIAHRRAGHVGHQLDPLGRVRDRAEGHPRVGRVPLAVEPREVVVADHFEVEAGSLGCRGVADERARGRLLGHQR